MCIKIYLRQIIVRLWNKYIVLKYYKLKLK